MRIEHDLLGDKSIPDDVYYGVQTARALENFHISGVPISQYPDLIRALGIVKLAASRANFSRQARSVACCRTKLRVTSGCDYPPGAGSSPPLRALRPQDPLCV